MSILDKITKGPSPRGRGIMLYGPPGIGKSTWAAQAEEVIFLQTEDGLVDLDVENTGLIKEFGEYMEFLTALAEEDNKYKTVVTDSIDWLEKLVIKNICKRHNKETLAEIGGYGVGYQLIKDYFTDVLKLCDLIREKMVNVIFLAHSEDKQIQPPDNEPYHRYEPRLAKQSMPIVEDWCDEILFVNYKVRTKEVESGFGQKRKQAIGKGERIIYTAPNPCWIAKNRKGLPEEIALDDYEGFWGCFK